MQILVLNPVIPFPPVSGGDLRTYHLIEALARRHSVTLVAFKGTKPFVGPPFPIRIVEVSWKKPRLWREMESADPHIAAAAYKKLKDETEEPWFVSSMESPEMEWTLRRLGRSAFDLVLIEHSNMARFLPALPPRVPKILNLHNVHTLMAQREAEKMRGQEQGAAQREAERIRRFEQRAAAGCALCLATSEAEAVAVRGLLGMDRVCVVPNGVDTSVFTPGSGEELANSLLFTGTMNYSPNVAAARYFAGQVLPLIRRQVPRARFHIAGAYPTAEVTQLACESVVVHGPVPDMVPFYRETALVVVPLLHGGGTRLKILEAAACGKAILSTSLGAEGLDFRAGEDIALADSTAEFVTAAVRLLRDEEERRRLGRHARRVAERYDWQGIGSAFRAAVEKVVGTGHQDAVSGRVVAKAPWRHRRQRGIEGRAFLIGCPRSGTTLLQSFLAAHPQIASFPESHFFTSLVSRHAGLCTSEIASPRSRPRFRAFARELGRPELAHLLPRRARLMRRHARAFVEMLDTLTLEQKKDHWVEKTPNHLHVVRIIQRYVPGARFIHLLRKGEEVVASLYDVTRQYPRQWRGPWSLDTCIAAWNSDLRRSWECRHDPDHCFVCYEQLLEDPHRVLQALCRFVGVDFHADMLARQRQVSAALVLQSEKWKARVTDGPRQAATSKFQTLFNAEEQAYIRSRLLRLDGWPPNPDWPRPEELDLSVAAMWAGGMSSRVEETVDARGGVPCF